MNYTHELKTPLLQLSNRKNDLFTLDDATRGVFVVGGTGSGKTSGSGRTLAKTYLKAGFGGLVLCHKPEEAENWKRYAAETNRSNSVIVMDGTGNKRFNFLEYELSRIDKKGSTTPLALDVFMKIYEFKQMLDGNSGGGNESFWNDSVRLLLSHSLDACHLGTGGVRFNELMEFIRTAPESMKTLEEPAFTSTLHYKIMDAADTNAEQSGDFDKIETFNAVFSWFKTFYQMDKKTRSNIQATLEAMALDFTKGDLARIFCTNTNLVPEMSEHGAVIVLDFPEKIYQRGGLIAQNIFKFAWMRAMERRSKQGKFRPVFLWCDEYQAFTNQYDIEFTATARGSKICTVFLTQSIPTLRAKLKADSASDAVETIISNLQTRIIHSAMDEPTKIWAADSIGKGLQWRYSENKGENQGQSTGWSRGQQSGNTEGIDTVGSNRQKGGNFGSQSGENRNESFGIQKGESRQQVVDYWLQPAFFGSGLRRGGESNNFLVDGVIVSSGRVWEYTEKPFLICSFNQKI